MNITGGGGIELAAGQVSRLLAVPCRGVMEGSDADRRWEAAVVPHLESCLRFATRLTGRPDEAEDLVQEAFVRAVARRETLRDLGAARSWLFRIVINSFRDRLRRPNRGGSLTGAEVCPRTRSPVETMATTELAGRIAGAVSCLPPRQRESIVLTAWEGFTPRAAAELLGISTQALYANLHEARRTLKQVLRDALPEKPQP